MHHAVLFLTVSVNLVVLETDCLPRNYGLCNNEVAYRGTLISTLTLSCGS